MDQEAAARGPSLHLGVWLIAALLVVLTIMQGCEAINESQRCGLVRDAWSDGQGELTDRGRAHMAEIGCNP